MSESDDLDTLFDAAVELSAQVAFYAARSKRKSLIRAFVLLQEATNAIHQAQEAAAQ